MSMGVHFEYLIGTEYGIGVGVVIRPSQVDVALTGGGFKNLVHYLNPSRLMSKMPMNYSCNLARSPNALNKTKYNQAVARNVTPIHDAPIQDKCKTETRVI